MQLNALTRSATGMTDKQCGVSNDMCGLRGVRELQTTQVANQASAGSTLVHDWTAEVPADVFFYDGEFASVSLRGAERRSNLSLEPSWIAVPRQAGARIDKEAWWWPKETAKKSWRRDLSFQVSSLVLGAVDSMTISTYGAFSTGRVPVGRGR